MNNNEKIRAALEKGIELLEPFQESGFLGDQALNLHKEALALLDTPAQAEAMEAMEAMEALDNLKAYVFNGSLIDPSPFFQTLRTYILQSPARPVVKPLAWVDYPNIDGKTGSYAKTTFGEYRIYAQGGVYWVKMGNKNVKFGTLEEAKAAAEAHWQLKIGECLG